MSSLAPTLPGPRPCPGWPSPSCLCPGLAKPPLLGFLPSPGAHPGLAALHPRPRLGRLSCWRLALARAGLQASLPARGPITRPPSAWWTALPGFRAPHRPLPLPKPPLAAAARLRTLKSGLRGYSFPDPHPAVLAPSLGLHSLEDLLHQKAEPEALGGVGRGTVGAGLGGEPSPQLEWGCPKQRVKCRQRCRGRDVPTRRGP